MRVRIGIGHPGNKDMVSHYVLHDFAKADQAWLKPLIAAFAEAAPKLWVGDGSRFLSDVARATRRPEAGRRSRQSRLKPWRWRSRGRPKHPAGDRARKSQNAIAVVQNLKKWLAARGDKGE